MLIFISRNSPHGTVIELLKNSGTSPTLLVQWRPLPTLDITPPLQRRLDERRDLHDVREEESLIDSAVEVDISPRNGYQYENVPLRDSLRNGYHYETIQPEFRNRNAGSDHKEFARNFREAVCPTVLFCLALWYNLCSIIPKVYNVQLLLVYTMDNMYMNE